MGIDSTIRAATPQLLELRDGVLHGSVAHTVFQWRNRGAKSLFQQGLNFPDIVGLVCCRFAQGFIAHRTCNGCRHERHGPSVWLACDNDLTPSFSRVFVKKMRAVRPRSCLAQKGGSLRV